MDVDRDEDGVTTVVIVGVTGRSEVVGTLAGGLARGVLVG